jgi:hypothetical protein
MARAGFKSVRINPHGLTDALDGTNAFPGAMSSLSNLIPAPHTANMWVPRPASFLLNNLSSFNTPTQIECLLVIGSIVYGMVATSRFSGKSEPFAYNVLTNAFETITGVTNGNTPTSIAAVEDWTPPTADVVGSRVVFTHPGFVSSVNYIGWLDISGFVSNSITGTTNGTATLASLSSNVLQAGWNIGMTVSSSAGDIAAGTTIASIASNGLSVTLSQAATGSNAGSTITVSGGSGTSPQWSAGNTNGNGLISVPVAVKNFNGRAYYAVSNGRQFSDSGNATQITNASQALTNQNGLPDTAFAGIPVTQTTGGVLQALIAFQGSSSMVMITGDQATSDLLVNRISIGVGTISPNTIAQTPKGTAFIATDGLRIIDLYGNVGDPIGANGQGVEMAFLQAIYPTRMAASFNGNVYRVSAQNGSMTGQPYQEYWYDFTRKIWSGPHTFPANLIQPLEGTIGNGSIIVPQAQPAQLWQSNSTPGTSDTFTENGVALQWTYQTCLLPDTGSFAQNMMTEGLFTCAMTASQNCTVTALDEFGDQIATYTFAGIGGSQSIWGQFVWGVGYWASMAPDVVERPIYWAEPVLFKQMKISATGYSATGTVLGAYNTSYKTLGYPTQLQV